MYVTEMNAENNLNYNFDFNKLVCQQEFNVSLVIDTVARIS